MDEEFLKELIEIASKSDLEIVIPSSPFRDHPVCPDPDPTRPVFVDYLDVIRPGRPG